MYKNTDSVVKFSLKDLIKLKGFIADVKAIPHSYKVSDPNSPVTYEIENIAEKILADKFGRKIFERLANLEIEIIET
jgi:hypothetical protein